MSNTYSQIYIQVVFAVKGRESLIDIQWEERLYKYITGIIRGKEQKLLAINGMPDHIHILIGIKPNCSLSDLVREVKKSSNEFIREKHLSKFRFSWQDGFGAFSYNHAQVHSVIGYIMDQKLHHQKVTFREEYLDLLKQFEIDHDNKYLFNWLD